MKDLSHGKNVSFQSMCEDVGGQSMEPEYHHDTGQNEYEEKHKSFMGKNGFDWSGMKGEK